MKLKLTTTGRALVLTAILFAGLCASIAILGRVTASFKEGMMFGVDATSDDLLNYTDSADADIRNAIKWKIKKCSIESDNAAAAAESESPERLKKKICTTGVDERMRGYTYMFSPIMFNANADGYPVINTNSPEYKSAIKLSESGVFNNCRSICEPSCKWG